MVDKKVIEAALNEFMGIPYYSGLEKKYGTEKK